MECHSGNSAASQTAVMSASSLSHGCQAKGREDGEHLFKGPLCDSPPTCLYDLILHTAAAH